MKRMIAVLMTAAMLLSGCGKKADPEKTEVQPTEASVTTLSTEPKPVLPMTVSFAMDSMDKFDTEDRSIKILDFDLQWITVTTPGNPGAGQAITEDLRLENEIFIEGRPRLEGIYTPMGLQECTQFARETYEAMKDMEFIPCCAERTYTLTGQGNILSVGALDYYFMGGAHGSHTWNWYNYDIRTGKRLTPAELSEKPVEMQEEMLRRMVEMARTEEEISGSIDWFEPAEYETALAKLLRDGSWHFEGPELVVSSYEYELGSYAAGTVDFPMAAEDFRDYLKPEYLPQKEQPGAMTLSAKTDLPLVGQLSMAENAGHVFLEASGTVYDVCLMTTETYGDGVTIHEGDPIWFCGSMTDSALAIRTDIPDTIPSLMVCYRTSDGQHRRQALTVSGENGRPFLMELQNY